MRILTLSYEFPPIGGGGSRVVKGLGQELIKLGHTIDVVTMGFAGLPEREVVNGITVHRVDCRRRAESRCTAREAFRYIRLARRAVAALLERQRYDLVHAHFILPDGYVAWREAEHRGVPFVLTAHGSDVPGYNQKWFFKIAHPLLAAVWRRVTGAAREIVSPSRTLAGMIRGAQPNARLSVMANGFDERRFAGAVRKRPQILAATRLVERKGMQYLLRALHGAAVEWPTIVVGSGEHESQLLQLNEELGRPARFVGWLDNESAQFAELLQESVIYVLPSDFENFPVSLLEAMAAGAAIITTRGHGCEEVVGDAAELVTPGSIDPERCVTELRAALERLTADPDYCAELGARARRRLNANFTWTAMARNYVKMYERNTHAVECDDEQPRRCSAPGR